MTREDFIGKTIKDIRTDNTIIGDKFREGFDINKVDLSDNEKGPYVRWKLEEEGSFAILYSCDTGFVICFKDEEPTLIFHVYELQYINLNAKRGRVTASGHETTHEYWFDDNEYSRSYTR